MGLGRRSGPGAGGDIHPASIPFLERDFLKIALDRFPRAIVKIFNTQSQRFFDFEQKFEQPGWPGLRFFGVEEALLA